MTKRERRGDRVQYLDKVNILKEGDKVHWAVDLPPGYTFDPENPLFTATVERKGKQKIFYWDHEKENPTPHSLTSLTEAIMAKLAPGRKVPVNIEKFWVVIKTIEELAADHDWES